MTEFNNVGKSHGPTQMPKEIAERAGTVGTPEIIQFSLRPGIKELGLHLKSWGETRTASVGSREVDWRMGGGQKDEATDALTKTANYERAHPYKSPRNPVNF